MARCAILAAVVAGVSGSFLKTQSGFVCGQQTTVQTSSSVDAAGTALFGDVSMVDGQCHLIGEKGVTAVKMCGPGTLTISRMTCSDLHTHKAMTVEHSSAAYTTNCETISLSGTVADGWLGSMSLTC